MGLVQAKAQARSILYIYNTASASQATNPHWGKFFWEAVDGWICQIGNFGEQLCPDMATLLRSHGFFRAHATAPPRESIRAELDAFATTGAPTRGAGLAALEQMRLNHQAAVEERRDPLAVPATHGMALAESCTAASERRFHTAPPADMRRAAPVIYRSMMTSSPSIREWLQSNYSASRQNDTWIDSWNAATDVDIELEGAGGSAELMRRLTAVDRIEIALRRLSAYIYEQRTHDRTGARAMLAVLPPGEGTDVASTWLVRDATEHPRMEHRRHEWVQRDSGRGRASQGRGRGKGHDDGHLGCA